MDVYLVSLAMVFVFGAVRKTHGSLLVFAACICTGHTSFFCIMCWPESTEKACTTLGYKDRPFRLACAHADVVVLHFLFRWWGAACAGSRRRSGSFRQTWTTTTCSCPVSTSPSGYDKLFGLLLLFVAVSPPPCHFWSVSSVRLSCGTCVFHAPGAAAPEMNCLLFVEVGMLRLIVANLSIIVRYAPSSPLFYCRLCKSYVRIRVA